MQTLKIKKIIVLLILTTISCHARDESNNRGHIWEGNIALPTSQQPGPLFSFGQAIVDEGDLIAFGRYDRLKGKGKQANEIFIGPVYGINSSSSVLIAIPFATHLKADNVQESGIENIVVQYEYAFFTKYRYLYGMQATVVGNIQLPTSSLKKYPFTNFGLPGFFLGATISYLSVNWYFFASSGVNFSPSRHGNKIGNEYFYQGGFGKNIAYSVKKWILAWILEFNGTYMQRNKFKGAIDQNSGGNLLFIGPSLSFTTNQLTFHPGISFPLAQHLFGQQNKNHYYARILLAWKFN